MSRWLVPLVAVAVVGVVLVLLLGVGPGGTDPAEVRREDQSTNTPPELRGLPEGYRQGPGREAPPERQPPEHGDGHRGAHEVVLLRGRVVADESGEAIAGARVQLLPRRAPCPRLPQPAELDPWTNLSGESGEDGRFVLRAQQAAESPALPEADVIVYAPGRVATMLCAPPREQEVEVRLSKGLSIQGKAMRADQRPIPGVSIRARPGPETPAVPGHASVFPVASGETGAYAIDGLLPGDVLVEADHPDFMPATWGPLDPATQKTLDLVLQPALRARFAVSTDDGREAKNATLTWEVVQGARDPQVLLLPPAPKKEGQPAADQAQHYGPVRLPATEGAVLLRVRADGYAEWTYGPFRPRPEGGEQDFDVRLTGDLSTGSVRIALEDENGERIDAAKADVKVAVAVLDPGSVPAAFVVMPREDLRITALPAGRYRVQLYSPTFAPVETELAVVAGQEQTATLRTMPPAKLRVRFLAPRRMLVRFRVLKDGKQAVAIPEGATVTAEGDVLAAGEDGLLLSGLGGGTYQVEVTSDEVAAPLTTVRLATGDTEEVEIAVSDR